MTVCQCKYFELHGVLFDHQPLLVWGHGLDHFAGRGAGQRQRVHQLDEHAGHGGLVGHGGCIQRREGLLRAPLLFPLLL